MSDYNSGCATCCCPAHTDHAQVGLQFNLEPLEGALQVLHLCAACNQNFRVRLDVLLHGGHLGTKDKQQ